jgi:hypothetical protein
MPKQKKLTKKEILEEKKDKDIWWQDSKSNSRKAITILIIFALFIIAIGSTTFLFSQRNKVGEEKIEKLQRELDDAKKNSQSEVESLQKKLDTAQKKLDDIEKAKAQKVTIEGSLSYPGNAIPTDMQICAQDIADAKNEFCTKEQVIDKKYTYGVGYKLELPTGNYFVYATVPSWAGYKSYYDEFVTCGMKYGCANHTPIEVKVESGKNLSGIDPVDWYKQN